MDINSFSSSVKLSSKQRKDFILINEVKKYRFLYDRNEMKHKNMKFRKNAWDEIGKVMGMDAIDCMNRWKIIRDKYRRERKMEAKNISPLASKKKWKFSELCSFLDPFIGDFKPYTEVLDEIMNEQEAVDSGHQSNASQEALQVDGSTKDDSSGIPPPPSQSAVAQNPVFNTVKILLPPSEHFLTPLPPLPKASPRKYVRILPKTEYNMKYMNPFGSSSGVDQGCTTEITSDQIEKPPVKEPEVSNTVDHLMTFMGNTLKQLPLKTQTKVCQELTSTFFNLISNEEEEEEEEEEEKEEEEAIRL